MYADEVLKRFTRMYASTVQNDLSRSSDAGISQKNALESPVKTPQSDIFPVHP